MFLKKHKKLMLGLATAAVIALGSTGAMAATTGASLAPAGYVDLSKVEVIPGTYTVVEGVTPQLEGGQTAATAPNPALTNASAVPVAPSFENVDASDLLGDNFPVKTLGPQDLHPLIPGQSYTTAAK